MKGPPGRQTDRQTWAVSRATVVKMDVVRGRRVVEWTGVEPGLWMVNLAVMLIRFCLLLLVIYLFIIWRIVNLLCHHQRPKLEADGSNHAEKEPCYDLRLTSLGMLRRNSSVRPSFLPLLTRVCPVFV